MAKEQVSSTVLSHLHCLFGWFVFETGCHYLAQISLELLILLPQPPECLSLCDKPWPHFPPEDTINPRAQASGDVDYPRTANLTLEEPFSELPNGSNFQICVGGKIGHRPHLLPP
jgi:hypothetical protein